MSTAPTAKFGTTMTPRSGLWRQPLPDPVVARLGEAARADDDVDALVDAPVHVVHHDVRRGEVDHHLGPGVGDVEQPVALVDHRHEFEVVGGVHGPAHLGAHAAARAQHADPDRLVDSSGSFSVTRPT